MADAAYEKKIESVKEYLPFLNTVIEKLRSDAVKHNRQQQLSKMESIRAMILGKRKLKIETLNKCEDVIRKLQSKMMNIDTFNNGRPNKRKTRFNRSQREHSPVRFPHENVHNFHGPPGFFRPNFFRGGKRGRFREFKRPRLQDMHNAPSFEEELECYKNLKREEPPEMWQNEGGHFNGMPQIHDQVNYNLEMDPQAEWMEQEMPREEYYNGPHVEIKREPIEMYPKQDFNNYDRHNLGFEEQPHEEQHPSASSWPEWKGYDRGGGHFDKQPFKKFHKGWQNHESDFNQDPNFTEDSYEMNFQDDSQRQYHTPFPKKFRGITFASRTTNVNIYTHHYSARKFHPRGGFRGRGRKFPITAPNGPLEKKPIKERISDVNPGPDEVLKSKPVKSKITVINGDNKSKSEEKIQIESKKKNPIESKPTNPAGLVEKNKTKEKATCTITSNCLTSDEPVIRNIKPKERFTMNDEANNYDGLILMDEYILEEPLSINESTEPIKSIEKATVSKDNIESNIELESAKTKLEKALPTMADVNKSNEVEPSSSHLANNETPVVINPSNTTSSEVVSKNKPVLNKPIKRTPIELMLMDFFDLGDLDKLTSELTIPTSPETEIVEETMFLKQTESVLTKTNTADEAGSSSIGTKPTDLNKSSTNTELDVESKLEKKSIEPRSTPETLRNLEVVTVNRNDSHEPITSTNTELKQLTLKCQVPSKPIESTSIHMDKKEKSSGILGNSDMISTLVDDSNKVAVAENVRFYEIPDALRTKTNNEHSSSITKKDLKNTISKTGEQEPEIFLECINAEYQTDEQPMTFIETVENKSCLARETAEARNNGPKELNKSTPSDRPVESNSTPVREAEVKASEIEEKETADLSPIKETNVSNGKNKDSLLSVKSTSSSSKKVECDNDSKDKDKSVQGEAKLTPEPITKKTFDDKPSTSKVVEKVTSSPPNSSEIIGSEDKTVNRNCSLDENAQSKKRKIKQNKSNTKKPKIDRSKSDVKDEKTNVKQVIENKTDNVIKQTKAEEKTNVKQVKENKTENIMTPPKNDKSVLTTFFSNLLSSDDKKQQKNALLSILTSFSTSFSNKQMKELSEVIAEDEEDGDHQESNQVESNENEKNVETKKGFCKKKKSELDKLHENLNDMLTENDVFGNDGRRSCRKKSTAAEKQSETVASDVSTTDRVLRNPDTRTKTMLYSSPDIPRKKSKPTLAVDPKPMKIILQKISQATSSPWKIQQVKEGNEVKNKTTPSKTQTKSLPGAKEKVLNVNKKSGTPKVKSKPTTPIKDNKVDSSNKGIKKNKITAKPQQSSTNPKENTKKDFCKHCGFSGRFLANHYIITHPNEEVDSSKFSPSQSQEAIEDARLNMELYEKQETLKFNGDAQLSYQCRFCPLNMKFVANFYDHITVHTGEFRRRCSGCHFKCSHSSTLSDHMKNVHPNHEKILEPRALKGPILFGYLCGSCNYVQIREENVRKHIKKHPGKNKPTVYKINMSSDPLEEKPEWLESKRFKKQTENISNQTVQEESNDTDTSSNVDLSDDDIDVDQLMKDIKNIVGSQSDNHDSDEFDID